MLKDIHCWENHIIKEMRPGLEWLSKALDTYFETTPEDFRNIKEHPLLKQHYERAEIEKSKLASVPPETQKSQKDDNRCIIL
jgi:hypothetical protein